MTRLAQLRNGQRRAVGLVQERQIRLLEGVESIYALANEAINAGTKLTALVERRLGKALLDYDSIYEGKSEWRLMVPIDHPNEPARCLVSGTGLTHLGSAQNRNSMHNAKESELTDSMKMFKWGFGGRQAGGGKNWRGAGVVLQGKRFHFAGTRGKLERACVCGGWRRGGGNRGRLFDWDERRAASGWDGDWQ